MLELLDRLKSTVQECAARADRLAQDSNSNASRLDWQTDKEIKELEAQLTTDIAGVDARFQSQRAQTESAHSRRKTALQRAHSAARKHHLKMIESGEGRQINEVQRELLQNSRDQEAQKKQADLDFANFQEELSRERDAAASLEQKARNAFRGYAVFRRLLDSSAPSPGNNPVADATRSLEEFRALFAQAKRRLFWFRLVPPVVLFRLLPPWLLAVLLVIVHGAAVFALPRFDGRVITWVQAGTSLAACLGGILALHFLGRLIAGRSARKLADSLVRTRALLDACQIAAETHYQSESERVRVEAETKTALFNQRWSYATVDAETRRNDLQRHLDAKLARATATNDRLFDRGVELLQRDRDEQIDHLRKQMEAERARLQESRSTKKRQFESSQQSQWQTLEADWTKNTREAYDSFAVARESAGQLFPGWRSPFWDNWKAPREFAAAAPFARLDVELEPLAGALPHDSRLALPGPASFSLPLLLTFPDQGSILFETKGPGRDRAIAALNNLVLRILSVTPPGRAIFTILDPLDLGQSFAGFMHLTDHEDRLINRRIWTQPEHIEQRLAELNEHIEKVTQLYLRNEFTTIAEYNEQAGRIAEAYHFLVVADFPVNFSDTAIRRLLSIIASGPRCGVFTLIHWDERKGAVSEFVPDDLRKAGVRVRCDDDGFVLADKPLPGATLELETPPEPDIATAFLQKVGRCSLDSNRVEMPFAEIAPDDSRLWTLETAAELRVPIGRTGATKFQQLALGKGTRQHVLIAGKTGSGKSTLFHVIITNLALWCGPDQVEFYLVDFKKGVEFKCYATHKLPHARVVAIESDREFGLSVLERLDEELRRRGDLFRQLGVQDLPGYKRTSGSEALPRTLLIIDEFQEFFVEDDRVSQNASLLLDRLVRQGRAFGIHVLLGSQTLGGAYTLARTTLGQMVVRVALQCNEADAMLIMDDDNPAPRLLSRPGEAIYNDASGAIEGNSPFQIVWLSEDERGTWLEKIWRRAEQLAAPRSTPVVFEGNAPADARENEVLQRVLLSGPVPPATTPRVWLGAPNSIKGPTEVVFHRQSGNNLLILGQRDEAALAILGVSLVALAAQHPRGSARFILLDVTPSDSRHREFLEKIVHAIPHEITLAGNVELGGIFSGLGDELEKRTNSERAAAAPVIYLFIHGIQRFKGLRYEDDFSISLDDASAPVNPGKQLNRIIGEGAQFGLHVVCTCDTVNNAGRFFSRKTLSEFELRVLFQMSANDSASLIDTPKAANLGLHRAILQNAQAGTLETFRPYGLPDDVWIAEAARNLASK
jgi:ABC-type multidrug transport system fused ATPase/permease subunit